MTNIYNERNAVVNINVSPQNAPTGRSRSKSVGVAVLLALFLGGYGAHRFYLHRPHASAMLGLGFALFILTSATSLPFLCITVVWALADIFSVRAWVDEANAVLGADTPSTVAGTSTPAVIAHEPSTASPAGDLESRLLHAAQERGGRITVTQGVLDTREPFDTVHDCLRGMVEDGYADVGNAPDSGVVVYTFGEL